MPLMSICSTKHYLSDMTLVNFVNRSFHGQTFLVTGIWSQQSNCLESIWLTTLYFRNFIMRQLLNQTLRSGWRQDPRLFMCSFGLYNSWNTVHTFHNRSCSDIIQLFVVMLPLYYTSTQKKYQEQGPQYINWSIWSNVKIPYHKGNAQQGYLL